MKRFRLISQVCALVVALLISSVAVFAQDPPEAPQNLAVEIVPGDNPMDPMTATLSWDAVPDAEGYKIYVKVLGEGWEGGEFEVYAETVNTSYEVDSRLVIGDGAYVFAVTAYNGNGESPVSNAVSSACGRSWNGGDLSEYNGEGVTAIVSRPKSTTVENAEYTYDVNTFAEYSANPTGAVVYNIDGPEGMYINPTTGFITWTPRAAGNYEVTVTAKATTGNEYNQQIWNLEVEADGVTSVGDNSGAVLATVYPNPTVSHVTVDFAAQAGKATIVLTDARGTEVLRHNTTAVEGANRVSLDVANLASGRYFLRVSAGSTTTVLPLAIT